MRLMPMILAVVLGTVAGMTAAPFLPDFPQVTTSNASERTADNVVQPAPVIPRLVVYERRDCDACKRFRRELLPTYMMPEGEPRFAVEVIDIEALGSGGYALLGPLSEIPSFVVMEDGREIGRVSGYLQAGILQAGIEAILSPRASTN